MVVVRVELWPGGLELGKKSLGTMYLANDGTGTAGEGSYDVKIMKFDGKGTWREGRVEGFDRQRRGPWDLIQRALDATLGLRNGSRG